MHVRPLDCRRNFQYQFSELVGSHLTPIQASVLPSERLLWTQFADSRHLPPSCTKSSAAWSGCEDGGEVAAGVTTAPVRCSVARLGAFVVNRLANAMLGTSNMRYQM